MTKCLDYLLIGTVALLLSGCGQEPATSPSSPVPGEKPAAATKSPATNGATATVQPDTGEILLFPAQPRSGDCLKAVVTGKKGPLVFQWRVNGDELSERTGNSLCDSELRRDDVVEVRLAGTEIGTEAVIANSPPRILEVSADVEAARQRGDIAVEAVTGDREGDEVELRYQWLLNDEEDLFSTGALLAADRYRKGDRIQFKLTPFDGFDEGETYVSAVLTIPNAPPMISSKPPETFEALEYLYPVQATDPDGDKLSYRLEDAPEGMSIDDAGLVRWNLAAAKRGDYPVKITVEDTDGGKAIQSFTINLGAPKQSSPNP
jgi:hypothetical protein